MSTGSGACARTRPPPGRDPTAGWSAASPIGCSGVKRSGKESMRSSTDTGPVVAPGQEDAPPRGWRSGPLRSPRTAPLDRLAATLLDACVSCLTRSSFIAGRSSVPARRSRVECGLGDRAAGAARRCSAENRAPLRPVAAHLMASGRRSVGVPARRALESRPARTPAGAPPGPPAQPSHRPRAGRATHQSSGAGTRGPDRRVSGSRPPPARRPCRSPRAACRAPSARSSA